MDKDTESAEKRLAAYKAKHSRVIELVRATVALENASLKPLYMLNGGALVVFLAFLGALASVEKLLIQISWGFVWAAIASWAVGLLLAAVTTVLAFKSQWHFLRAKDTELRAIDAEDSGELTEAGREFARYEGRTTTGQNYRTGAMCVGGISLLAFLAGIILGILGVV